MKLNSNLQAGLSTIPPSLAGLSVAFGQQDGSYVPGTGLPFKGQLGDGAQGLGIGFGGPTAVHLIGTFAINNFGGLGGGL